MHRFGGWVVDDVAVLSPPVFSAGDRPASIIDGAGRWLADELGSPYRWLPGRRLLKAEFGALAVSFNLQGSSRSRAGQGTSVSVQVIVEDEGLYRWRQEHRVVGHRVDGEVVRTYLVNLVPSAVTVELYGQLRGVAPQMLSLPDLAEVLRAKVLPVLPCLHSPAEAVLGLPERWWLEPHGLVEWALSRGDPDSARQMVKRYLTRNRGSIEAFQQGLANADHVPGSVYRPDAALGRLAATMGLLDAEEEIPISARKRRRTLLQRLRGDR